MNLTTDPITIEALSKLHGPIRIQGKIPGTGRRFNRAVKIVSSTSTQFILRRIKVINDSYTDTEEIMRVNASDLSWMSEQWSGDPNQTWRKITQ